MKGTIRQQIEGLKAELRPEKVVLVVVHGPDPEVEPAFYAIGGSDEAKARAIEQARRAWREAREASS